MTLPSSSNRGRVWAKTDGYCWYCGVPLVMAGANENRGDKAAMASWFAVDHLLPKTLGGTNDIENLVPACLLCNSSKNNKPLEIYRVVVSLRSAGQPVFTPEQIAWLQQQGFQFPDVELVEFYGESLEEEQTR